MCDFVKRPTGTVSCHSVGGCGGGLETRSTGELCEIPLIMGSENQSPRPPNENGIL